MPRRSKLSTKMKRKIAKATGIPTTKSGRKQKARRLLTGGCLTYVLAVATAITGIIGLFITLF